MKSKVLFFFLALILVAGMAVVGCAPEVAPPEEKPTQEPIVLKSTTPLPPNSFLTLVLDMFEDEIEKQTDGLITFERFYGGALFPLMETMDGISSGAADIGQLAPPWHPGKLVPGNLNYACPFKSTNVWAIVQTERQMYEEFPAFGKNLEDYNLKMVMIQGTDDYGILTKEPMRTLDDFKGMKVAVLGGYFASWVEVTGAVVMASVAPERYMQLKTGVIDGDILQVDIQYANKSYEVGKYCMNLGVGANAPLTIVVNLDTFNKLTPEYQKLFIEVGKDIEKQYHEMFPQKRLEYIKLMEEEGVTFCELSDEDRAKWASLVPDSPGIFARENEAAYPEVWDWVKRYQEIAEEYGTVWTREYGIRD